MDKSKKRRSGATTGIPTDAVPVVPVAGTRAVFINPELPVFLNRIPDSTNVALFHPARPLDSRLVVSALSSIITPLPPVRATALSFNGAAVPGLVVSTGSSQSADLVYSLGAKAPAVVDGALVGLRAWLSSLESAKVDTRELQSSVDAFMADFDARHEWTGAEISALTRRMDADGFTLVTRKKGGAAAASSVLPGLSASEESDNAKLKRKRGSLVRADFYAFQGRDNKLDRLEELRRRFEEDKERIRRMKQSRCSADFT